MTDEDRARALAAIQRMKLEILAVEAAMSDAAAAPPQLHPMTHPWPATVGPDMVITHYEDLRPFLTPFDKGAVKGRAVRAANCWVNEFTVRYTLPATLGALVDFAAAKRDSEWLRAPNFGKMALLTLREAIDNYRATF